ncbi:MAG: hypothetical protein NTX81_10535 [Candidatus Bathyarchaeota archaeon]|nr:hypothetical protein [Candidatus Bathyarchaeota archaeon]
MAYSPYYPLGYAPYYPWFMPAQYSPTPYFGYGCQQSCGYPWQYPWYSPPSYAYAPQPAYCYPQMYQYDTMYELPPNTQRQTVQMGYASPYRALPMLPYY